MAAMLEETERVPQYVHPPGQQPPVCASVVIASYRSFP